MSDRWTDPLPEAPEDELELARRLARGALASLEQASGRIDDLNVYPVPDGDTGSNLVATLRAVVGALEAPLPAERMLVAQVAARAARMGGRGNAGVILAQCLQGALEALPASGPVAAATLAAMLRSAQRSAFAAARGPAGGTMLSVIGEIAEVAEACARGEVEGGALLESLSRRAREALARTREELPALREAAVVDAGGAGVVACLQGLQTALASRPGKSLAAR
ncbi:MAG: DAK2 domain-containing protein [Gaiellaceae bacterium]